jgi:hypothetical protein
MVGNMEQKLIIKLKEKQPWKIDIYSPFSGKEPHSHEVISGAILIKGKVIGGTTYYLRDINQRVIINLDENGRSRI